MLIHEFTETEAFYQGLTELFIVNAETAVRERGEFSVALSGGKTPGPFYQRLNKAKLPWKQIAWFLGDERWVAKGDSRSNETMVLETLGAGRPDFLQTFFSWYLAGNAELAAKLYQQKMFSSLGEPPLLDLSLLGVGSDGHTASLFPGTTALDETKLYAAANTVPQSDVPQRLTMTYPVFNAAREIWFLVTGSDKAPMIDRLLNRDQSIPSARIQNPNQHLFWLK